MAVLLDLTKIVPITHEPGQTLTIKRLSPKQLKAASDAHSVEALLSFRRFGGGEMLEALGKMDSDPEARKAAQAAAKAEAEKDPASGYDHDTLIKDGLLGWSYTVEFTPEHVERLDPETKVFAATEIAAHAKGLSSAEARGNG